MSCHILQGDCFQLMDRLPAQCVNLVLCDLPYGITRNKWDSVLSFEDLWAHWKRLLVPGGMVVLTASGLFTAQVMLSNPEWFKYKLVWVKPRATNFLNAKKQPLRKHEDICVFCEVSGCYNPQMVQGVPYVRKQKARSRVNYGEYAATVTDCSDGLRYPTDILDIEMPYMVVDNSGDTTIHPTQKPLELGKWLVRTYTNPGDTVLDCCCGSGSFVIAAALEGRHAIGMELDGEMCEKARARAERLLNE